MNETFRSLRESRNFRRYFIGQSVSLAGTWMQSVAQGWLVLKLTGSVTQVGLIAAAQTLPILLLAPSAGLFIDRHDTRRVLLATQATAGALAGILGLLTVTGAVHLWMVYVLAGLLGVVTAVDNPARQSFVNELVVPDLIGNAVTLNTININAARVIGPGLAAAVIALFGVGPCFLINAASYVAVVIALARMRPSELLARRREERQHGQVREGLRYVWHTDALRVPLVMMALIGTLTYEFTVSLPAMAKVTFHGSASTFGLMTGAMGLGAVMGGLFTAGRPRHGLDVLVRQAAIFGLAVLAAAVAPTLWLAIVALLVVGATSLAFLARANTTMQLLAEPTKRGRVMALWTVAFLGTTPVGAPVIGFIGDHAGPRWSLVTGGVTALVAAAYGAVRRSRATTQTMIDHEVEMAGALS
ncbi:MAG: MFS transporter [Acidimicrobiales bacterium]